MMKILKIKIALLICCFAVMFANAQSTYTAKLPQVDTDAFYIIDLPYQVLGNVCKNFADVRLYDSMNREIAWLLRDDITMTDRKSVV